MVGTEELIAALRREGEKKSRVIREKAEAEAARLESEAADRLARLREESGQEQKRSIAAEESAILAEAERTARRNQLAAMEKLAKRLSVLARRSLPRLRTSDYPGIFARLAAELPPVAWERVRVNPADAEMAAHLLPGVRIMTDSGISGGLEAMAKGESVVVINTLEKRLERAWPELLPPLLEEIENSG